MAAMAVLGGTVVAQNRGTVTVPVFEVDPDFPAMPDNMLLGGVAGARRANAAAGK
jgi:hypothetical protein